MDVTFEIPAPFEAAAPPVSPPPPPPFPSSEPGAAVSPTQSSGIRLCRSCGYMINPGDKFCKKCLAKVAEDFSAAPSPLRQPPGDSAPPPVSPPVCTSCGSPISGMEKFCGICGTPLVPVPPAPATVLPPGKMTCTHCGVPSVQQLDSAAGAVWPLEQWQIPVQSRLLPPPHSYSPPMRLQKLPRPVKK